MHDSVSVLNCMEKVCIRDTGGIRLRLSISVQFFLLSKVHKKYRHSNHSLGYGLAAVAAATVD